MSTTPPLEGIRVLDIGTLIAGPFGATLLGDFGAEIIKIEQKRYSSVIVVVDLSGSVFVSTNDSVMSETMARPDSPARAGATFMSM